MAHKKAAGSAKNLRDSNAKYRGIKLFGWQKVVSGNIIVRQKWSKYECWKNTYLGKDFSIHAKMDWVVVFSKKKFKRFDGRKYLKTVVNVEMKVDDAKVASKVKKVTEKKVSVAKKETAE